MQKEYDNSADDKKERGIQIKKFVWITDIELTMDNVKEVMRGGRSRWKIENETFQTLKVETAYDLEHSYGHEQKNLCTIFGMLAMLAFLIDQVQEITCPLFRKALGGQKAKGVKRKLWELLRNVVEWFVLDTWETLFKLLSGMMPAVTPVWDDFG